MASRRIERLNEQLKREITTIVREEVRDPRVGMVTVTAVDVSADLSVARVYINVLGEDEARRASLEGLRAAAPFIRTELGKQLHVRRAPELRFEIDRSLDYAMRIERLLREALPEEGEKGAEGEGNGAGGADER
jgi:ribosome-binding factor A